MASTRKNSNFAYEIKMCNTNFLLWQNMKNVTTFLSLSSHCYLYFSIAQCTVLGRVGTCASLQRGSFVETTLQGKKALVVLVSLQKGEQQIKGLLRSTKPRRIFLESANNDCAEEKPFNIYSITQQHIQQSTAKIVLLII